MTEREKLPNRRDTQTITAVHGGIKFHASLGFYEDGRVGEIFTHGRKVNSTWQGVLNDASIMISNLLQMGLRPAELAAKVAREDDDKTSSSILGLLLDMADNVEKEMMEYLESFYDEEEDENGNEGSDT